MTKDGAHEHKSKAEDCRENGEFEQAGEHFTAAAYEEFGILPSRRFYQHRSHGLYYLLHAAVCYRLAELDDRCHNRCEQGRLICEDVQARVMELPTPENDYDRVRRGAWDEFIGDFYVIAGQECAEAAYDRARSTYETADEIHLGFAEWEHLHLIWFFESLALAVNQNLDTWYDRKSELSFPEWIDHKREQLPAYYDRLIQAGTWE